MTDSDGAGADLEDGGGGGAAPDDGHIFKISFITHLEDGGGRGAAPDDGHQRRVQRLGRDRHLASARVSGKCAGHRINSFSDGCSDSDETGTWPARARAAARVRPRTRAISVQRAWRRRYGIGPVMRPPRASAALTRLPLASRRRWAP